MFQGMRKAIASAVKVGSSSSSPGAQSQDPNNLGEGADMAVVTRACLGLQAPLSLSKLLGQENSRDFDLAQGPVRISRDGFGFRVVLNLPLNLEQTLQIHIMDCYDQNSHFVRGFSEFLERVQREKSQHYEVVRRPGSGYAHTAHDVPEIDLCELLDS